MEPLQLRSMRNLLRRLETIGTERSRAVLNVDVLRQMALCVLGLGTPFLLSGPSGGGKSFLIKQLWAMLRAELELPPILWLSLDDSVDSKVLLGSWVSAKELGSFEWQDGVLSSAMKLGQWIVIEDVDQANPEVLAKLSELTTHRSLFVSERHVTVDAHANFALFGTVSRTSSKVLRSEQDVSSDIQLPPLLLGWHQGVCPLMTESAVNKVISVKFPELSGVSELLSNAYVAMVTSFHTLCRGETRPVSIRQLFVLCSRLQLLIRSKNLPKPQPNHNPFLRWNSDSKRKAVVCAQQVFAASLQNSDLRTRLASDFAWSLNLTHSGSDCYDSLGDTWRTLLPESNSSESTFAMTSVQAKLLENLEACFVCGEPVLLVGDTGTGKTALVQEFARQQRIPHERFIVYNFNDQSDASDILGQVSPIDTLAPVHGLRELWLGLMQRSRDRGMDSAGCLKLVMGLEKLYAGQKWKEYLNNMQRVSSTFEGFFREKFSKGEGEVDSLALEWLAFRQQAEAVAERMSAYINLPPEKRKQAIEFRYQEGLLIKALREGMWLVLDEINLAPLDVLHRLHSLFDPADSQEGSGFVVIEDGGRIVERHPDFRVFACMNPPSIHGPVAGSNVGKKDLPRSVRQRFTEIFVDELTLASDLEMIVRVHLRRKNRDEKAMQVENSIRSISPSLVKFYQAMRREILTSGRFICSFGDAPTVSLRTLTRILQFAVSVSDRKHLKLKLPEAVAEGVMAMIGSPLQPESVISLMQLLAEHGMKPRPLLASRADAKPDKNQRFRQAKAEVSRPMTQAAVEVHDDYVLVEGHPIKRGPLPLRIEVAEREFIVTDSVRKQVAECARLLSGGRYPLLLEGLTSAGKTSLVEYLCRLTGHTFLRINNHEHTDIQEYIGQHVPDPVTGLMIFEEGPLVKAARNGDWIVLDELNLAPSEVLESLNRLLDDNRELVVPGTGAIVRAHDDFMLFATQNPAGNVYGGRKVLSRALRNRFVEVHVSSKTLVELQTLLEKRCQLPTSDCKRMVAVYNELHKIRLSSAVFNSEVMTIRGLLRWGRRWSSFRNIQHAEEGWNDQEVTRELAREGYFLFAEGLRDEGDKTLVMNVLRRCVNKEFEVNWVTDPLVLNVRSMFQEAVKNTPTEELPSCLTSRGLLTFTEGMCRLVGLVQRCILYDEPVLVCGETGAGKTTAIQVLAWLHERPLKILNCHQNTETADIIGSLAPTQSSDFTVEEHGRKRRRVNAKQKALAMFQWQDGPLTASMRQGNYFLLDEISLTDDAVLERFNSVLEPSRFLTLVEKGSTSQQRTDEDKASLLLDALRSVPENEVEHVKAHATFRLFATMNPGGDYGKKELSPALRDRMTELWCPAVEFDSPDMRELLASRLPEVPMRASLGRAIQEMIVWFNSEARHPVSIREALVWADFIHSWKGDCAEGFVHGGLSTLVDGLGTGNELLGDGKSIGLVLIGPSVEAAEVPAFDKTLSQSRATARLLWCAHTFLGCTPSLGSWDPHVTSTEVSVGPFCATGPGRGERPPPKFTFLSPTTRANLTRLLRSMHTPRAVLLEGSPGVGKTSLVCSLAEFIGQPVTKVNVSEHTDVGDLLGYVLPKTDNEDFLEFAWQDGVLLTAMKEGRWIILDELNLANQQVLESLNALLDHRREVYVPQIDRTIRCAPTFRLFATQNPLCEGGGRKGLPRSFLNRFSRIMVDALSSEDLNFIGCAMYPNIAEATIKQIIDVVDVFSQASFRGSWEWNLRDVLRILALVERRKPTSNPGSSVAMLAMSRLKCPRDRSYASDAIRKVFSDRLDFSPAAFRDMLTHGMPESLMTALAAPPLPECAELPLESDCLPIATPKPFILKELEAVAHSVRVGIELTWPVLLTGPPMSGKATLVRQIALEHHATLIEIFLTESVDAVELLGSFEQLHSSCDSVKFGWVDGNFVRAVESGQWVLFRHAHMAPAAVLDRLNSILEADGELLITECGEPRQLRPHPEFRCFFTAQGVNGISRALRNRCHEVDIGLPTLWGVPCGPHRNLLSGWDDLATRILTQIPLEGIPGVEPLVDGDSLVVPAQLSLTAVDLCDAYRVARRHASVDVSYVAALIFLLHLTLHRFSDSLQVRSRMPTLETLPDLAHSHRSQIVSLVRLLALGDDPWAAFTQSFRGTLPTAEPLRSIFQAGVRICSSEDLIGRLKPLLDVDDPIERCFAVMEAVDCPIEKASLARGLLLDAQTLDIPRVLSALSSRLPAGLLRHSTLLAGVGAMLPASTCYPSVQAAFVDGERDLMSWARLYEASVMFCISPHWQTLENPAFTIDGQLHVTAVEAIRRLERRNLLPGPLVGVFGIQFWMEMEFTVDPRWDVGEIEQADLALRSLSWLLHHLVEEVPPFALDGNAIAYKHELSGSVSRCRDAASMLSRSSFSAPAALAALHADITSSAVSKETPLDRAFYPSTRELPQVAVMKAVVSGLFGAALPDRRLVESVYLTTLSPEKLRTLKYSYGLTDQGVDLKGLTLATRFLGLCEVAEALQHQRRSDKAFAMQSMLCTQLLAPLRSPVNQTTSRLSGVAHSPGTALTTAVGMFSLMSVVQEVGHFSRYAGNNALHATQRLQSAVKLLSLANLPLDEILPVFDFSTFVQLLGAWMAYLWTAQDGCDMDITDRLLQKCSSLAFKLLTPSPEASRGPGCPQLTSWVTWQDSLALYGPVFKEEISVPATSNLSLGEVSPFISADFVCPFAASFVEMSKECGMVHLPCIRRTLRLLQRRLAFQQPSTNWSDLSSLLLHVASFLDFPEVANRPLPELTSAIEARLAAVTDNNPAGLITRAVLASLLWLADASDDSTWVPLLQTCIGMGRLLQDPCRSHSVSKALSSVLLESRSRLLEYFTLQMDQVEREELRQRLFRMETGRLPSASGVCAEDFKQTAVWIRSVLSEHVVRRDPLQWSDLPTSMSRHIEESEAESTLPVQESNLVLEMLLQRGETKRLKRTIASLESSSHTEDLLANHQKWCREIGHQFGMEREIHSLLQDQKAFLQDAVFDPNSGIWNCLASPLQRVATEGSAGLLDAFPAAFAVMGRFRQLLGGYVQRSIKRYPFFRDLAIPVETAASMVVQGMDQLCCQLSPEAVALRSQLKGTSDAIIGHVACFGRQPLLGLSQAVSIHFAVDETATEERNEEAITVAVQQSKVADLKRRVVFKPILSPMLDPQSLLTLTQWGLSWLGTYHNHCRRFSERSATQAVIKLVSSLGFLCVEVERRAREEETRKLQGFLQDHVGRATDVAGITENHVWWEGTRQEERKELLDTLFPNADTTSVLDRLQIPESALGSHQEVYNHYETGVEEKDIGTAPLHVTNQGPFALTRAHVEHVVELLLDAVAPVGEAPSELTYRKAMGLGIHVTSKIMRHALNSRPTPQNVESLHVLTLGALRSEEALFLQERLTKEAEEEMHLIRTLMKDDTVVALAPLAGESDEEMQLRVDREDYLRERARKVKFKELQRSLRNSMKLYNSAASSFYADANPTLVAPSWNVVQSLLIRVDELLKIPEFEDHPALSVLRLFCERMGSLSLSSLTAASTLATLEVLYDRCLLWEDFAHKEISLRSPWISDIQREMIRLRRHQLNDWKYLREFREQASARKAYHWFTDLVEMFVKAAAPSMDSEELARQNPEALQAKTMTYDSEDMQFFCIFWRILEHGVLSKPLGEFHARIRMTLALSRFFGHAEHPRVRLLALCCGFFYKYCQAWVPTVDAALQVSRKEMDKAVKELVTITKWNFQNLEAMRESTKRSHRKLAEVIKAFEEHLRPPVVMVLDGVAAKRRAEDAAKLEAEAKQPKKAETAENTDDVASPRFVDALRIRRVRPTGMMTLPCVGSTGLLSEARDIRRQIRESLVAAFTTPSNVKERWMASLLSLVTDDLAVCPISCEDENQLVARLAGFSRFDMSTASEEFAAMTPDRRWCFQLRYLLDPAVHDNVLGGPGAKLKPQYVAFHYDDSSVEALVHSIDSLLMQTASEQWREAEASSQHGLHLFLGIRKNVRTGDVHQDVSEEAARLQQVAGGILNTAAIFRDGILNFTPSLAALADYTQVICAAHRVGALQVQDASRLRRDASFLEEVTEALLQLLSLLKTADEVQDLKLAISRDPSLDVRSTEPETDFPLSNWQPPVCRTSSVECANVELLFRARIEALIGKTEACVADVVRHPEGRLLLDGSCACVIASREVLQRWNVQSQSVLYTAQTLVDDAQLAVMEIPPSAFKPLATLLHSRSVAPFAPPDVSDGSMKKASKLWKDVMACVTKTHSRLAEQTAVSSRESYKMLMSLSLPSLVESLQLLVCGLDVGCCQFDVKEAELAQLVEVYHYASLCLLSCLDSFAGMAMTAVEFSRVVSLVMLKGYCREKEEEEGETMRGADDWVDGTGMGEGQGEKDVADEIEDQTQMEGFKGEEQSEPEKQKDETETGVDVDFGFDGQTDNKQQDDMDDEDSDNPHDVEQDTVDLDDGGQLEKKKKDEEEEDVEDAPPEKGDDKDENIETTGQKSEEQELGANDDPQDSKQKQEETQEGEDGGGDECGEEEGDASEEEDGDEEGHTIDFKLDGAEQEDAVEDEHDPEDLEVEDGEFDEGEELAEDGEDFEDDEIPDDLQTPNEEDGDVNEEAGEEKGDDVEMPPDDDEARAGADDDMSAQRNQDINDGNDEAYGANSPQNAQESAEQKNDTQADSREEQSSEATTGGQQGMSKMKDTSDRFKKQKNPMPNPIQEPTSAIQEWLKQLHLEAADETKEEDTEGTSFQQDNESKLEGVAEAIESGKDPLPEIERDPADLEDSERNVELEDATGGSKPQGTTDERPEEADATSENDVAESPDLVDLLAGSDSERPEAGSADCEVLCAPVEEDDEALLPAASRLPAGISEQSLTRQDVQRLWRYFDARSEEPASQLCEMLRLILEPTTVGRLKGDYRTGKRINMRKVIPFIASNFRKDKIWLRRTKPSKRQYDILVCIDNSQSVSQTGVAKFTLDSLFVICKSLSKLEAGDLSVVKFGGPKIETLVHKDNGFSETTGRALFEKLTFAELSANSHDEALPGLFDYLFKEHPPLAKTHQMCLVISDGRFNKDRVRPFIQRAVQMRMLPLMVCLDSGSSARQSIQKITSVRKMNGKMVTANYLDDFPFPTYCVVDDPSKLTSVVSNIVRQFVQMTTQAD